MVKRLIRIKEVCRVTGLSKSTLYAKIADGSFPRSVQLTERCVAWNEADIEAWIQERIDEGTSTQVTS